jgi:Porin subfamily
MNIKSLLLGSAAALVAVSGARAADAVMAEPEAVEYVRVCDAYGAGFFYIPGTETCLKIAGRVRYQIDYATGDNGWKKNASAMLNFTAKSDTELGTLTSYIEMEAVSLSGNIGGGVVTTDANGNETKVQQDGAFAFGHAWISLGGLKMGRFDTLYDGDINGEGDAGGGAGVHFIGYTFSGANGFSATLNLEEETNNVNYVPNVVGKLSFTQGWGGFDAWAAYDDDDNGALAGDAAWSVKGRLTANVGSSGVFQMLATYNGSGKSVVNADGSISHSNFYANGGRWTVGASYKHTFNPKLALTGMVQYQADTNYEIVGRPNNLTFGAVIDYTVVPNFTTKLAVWHKTNGAAPNTTQAFLRFQREF